jgi:hypothetical protein
MLRPRQQTLRAVLRRVPLSNGDRQGQRNAAKWPGGRPQPGLFGWGPDARVQLGLSRSSRPSRRIGNQRRGPFVPCRLRAPRRPRDVPVSIEGIAATLRVCRRIMVADALAGDADAAAPLAPYTLRATPLSQEANSRPDGCRFGDALLVSTSAQNGRFLALEKYQPRLILQGFPIAF